VTGFFPLAFDHYLKNIYYFQFRIEANYEESPNMAISPMLAQGRIKMSVGLVRNDFDLNKNSIIENKKKDYWVLDAFDGEVYCAADPGNFVKYVK